MITNKLKNVGYLINIFIGLLFTKMVVPVGDAANLLI